MAARTLEELTEYVAAQEAFYRRRCNDEPDPELFRRLSLFAGLFYDYGVYDMALSYYEKCLAMGLRLYDTNSHQNALIGKAYANVSCLLTVHAQYQRANDGLLTAHRIYDNVYGKDAANEDVAGLYNLYGDLMFELGAYEKASSYYCRALSIFIEMHGEEANDEEETALTYINLGRVAHAHAEYDAADWAYNKADFILLQIHLSGSSHTWAPRIPLKWSGLHCKWAQTLRAAGNYQSALSEYSRAAEILREFNWTAKGLHHVNLLEESGDMSMEQCDYTAAYEFYFEASKLIFAFCGDNSNLDWCAINLVRSANIFNKLNMITRAENQLKTARETFEKVHDNSLHPAVGRVLNRFGELLRRKCEYTKSLAFHFQALSVFQSSYGEEAKHPDIALTFSLLANLYCLLEDYNSSKKYNTLSLDMNRVIFGGDASCLPIFYNYLNIGTTYLCLQDYDQASLYFKKAKRVLHKLYGRGASHKLLARVLNLMGITNREKGDLDAAVDFHQEASNMYIRTSKQINMGVVNSYTLLGDLAYGEDDYKEAISNYDIAQRECEKLERQHNFVSIESAKLLTAMGRVQYKLYNFRWSMNYYGRAKASLEQIFGADSNHSGQAIIYKNCADVSAAKGNYGQALRDYMKSLEIKRRIYSEYLNREDIAELHYRIARMHTSLAMHSDALGEYRHTLEIRELYYTGTTDHIKMAEALDGIGTTLLHLANYDEALEYFEKSLSMKKRLYGASSTHRDIILSHIAIGKWYIAQRKYKEGRDYHQEAASMSIGRRALQFSPMFAAQCHDELGKTFCVMGEHRQASTAFKYSLDLKKREFTINEVSEFTHDSERENVVIDDKVHALEYKFCPPLGRTYLYMGDNHLADGSSIYRVGPNESTRSPKFTEALTCYEDALEMFKKAYRGELHVDHVDLAAVYSGMGCVYQQPTMAQYDKALEYHTKARDCRESIYRPHNDDHPDIARSYINMAHACTSVTKHQQAHEYLYQALAKLKAHPSGDAVALDIADVYEALGVNSFGTRDYKQALEFYQECLKIRETKYGRFEKFNSFLASIYGHLEKVYTILGEANDASRCTKLVKEISIPSATPKDRKCKVM